MLQSGKIKEVSNDHSSILALILLENADSRIGHVGLQPFQKRPQN
jgi:hypothetical protein